MNEPLPENCYPDSSLNAIKLKPGHIEAYIKSKIPKSDSRNVENDLKYTFILDRLYNANPPKRSKIKRNFLTRKQRKELNLLKLPKSDWDYNSLKVVNELWKQYMRHNLEFADQAPGCQDQEWANFSQIAAKSELIGAEIKVVRSKVPSQVGICGILALETKMTFQIVTRESKLKVILKETAVFEFKLDNMKFTVFGKHLITRPSERSVKKIKTFMVPDL